MNQKLYECLKISDYGRKSFTDRELCLSSKSKSEEISSLISSNKQAFDTTELKFDICKKCNRMLLDTRKGFCGGCGASEGEVSKIKININKNGFINIAFEQLKKLVPEWAQTTKNSNFFLLKKKDFSLASAISLEETSLKEYYMLRGWLELPSKTIFIMVARDFDKELRLLSTKNSAIILLDFQTLLCDGDKLNSLIEYSIENNKEEINFERKLGGRFDEELNLLDLKERLDSTLSSLDSYALHKNTLTPQDNGRKYQKAIVELLNQTIFSIKVLIKNDIQDVFIRIPQNYIKKNQQVKWIPLEIKSFGINERNKGKFSIRDYSSQYRKYIEGHINNPLVTSSIDVCCFSILAKDFLLDKDNLEAIEEIERHFEDKIHISLLPQDTLIYLINKRIDQKSPIIDFDHILSLFRDNRFIGKEDVDRFYKSIEADFKKSPESTALKSVQEKVHRQGK